MNKILNQTKIIFFMCIIFVLFINSCNYIQTNQFAFSPTPENGQSGGVSGVYVYEAHEKCGEQFYSYGIVRLYDDGTVLYVSTCSDGDIIKDWVDIKNWFHLNNEETTYPRGIYFVSQNQIWFRTQVYYDYTGESVTTDYFGTYSVDKLILDTYSHYNGFKAENREYLRLAVDE